MQKRREGRTKRRGGRLLGAFAFAAGALGTTLLLRRRNRETLKEKHSSSLDYLTRSTADRWARPGMEVTFRAELMPGRSRAERTFRVASLLPSGRVTIEGVAGEHAEGEFEAMR